ncbi:MAG: protein kinase [Lachnospiraceae bacterium]|nr:protein kinase [Lachnospiraceae bacterium]
MSNTRVSSTGLTLPSGSVLHDNYIVEAVLGEGGFGITYSAIHRSTNEKVAIKEYFPSGIALRNFAGSKPLVTHPEGKLATSFNRGMHRFLNEAALLKSFQHLGSIVSVHDVFEENDTAYLVMEYIEGITLKELVKNEGPMPFDELLDLMKPVLLDLHEVHKQGLIHRDISPENLIVGMDNRLHVIDFGAASFSNPNESKTMTVILKSGYAPPEQYIPDGKTGAWTDVYALCATMYMVLTGNKPTEAVRRMQTDYLPPIPASTGIATFQAKALYTGLSLNSAERFATTKLLYQALTTEPVADLTATKESNYLSDNMHKKIQGLGHAPAKRKPWKAILLVGILCIASIAAIQQFNKMNRNSTVLQTNITSASSENSTEKITTEEDTTEHNTTQETLSPQILTMVNIEGSSLEQARITLSKLDSSIQVNVTEEYNTQHAAGIVISQSISPDTQFTKGQIAQIQLVVSKGTEPVANQKNTHTQTSTQTSTPNSDAFSVKSNDTSDKSEDDDDYTTIHLD